MMNEVLVWDDPKFIEFIESIGSMVLEFGIKNLSMGDISRNLRISKKTLYRYFKNKEDLIEKLFEYDDVKCHRELCSMEVKGSNAIDLLFLGSSIISNEIKRMDPKLKFELKKYYGYILDNFLINKQNHIFEQISKNIRKGIEEGLYRSDINIEITAGLYVKNLLEMPDRGSWFMENINPEEIFKAKFETMVRSIATPAGIVYFEKRKREINEMNKDL
jgi:TetR/AcrR family transcriptional regulator, cholesterol catabolism regulator